MFKWITFIILIFGLAGCSQHEDDFYAFQESVGSEIILEEFGSAQYFTYSDGYSCVHSSGKVVPSFTDSIYFTDGKICRTGDLCNQSINCVDASEVSDYEMLDGNFKVSAFGSIYSYGADLNETDGKPTADVNRVLASIERDPDMVDNPGHKNLIIIYALWIMAIAMTLYMHAPE
ncbi:MAG: hypothetical protein CL677_02710 [Bdellovibrionaceae bacterium]|nr:hypothetical protein [Pseudobdellovibrionaceae bacterium]